MCVFGHAQVEQLKSHLEEWNKEVKTIARQYPVLQFFTVSHVLELRRDLGKKNWQPIARAFSFLFDSKCSLLTLAEEIQQATQVSNASIN